MLAMITWVTFYVGQNNIMTLLIAIAISLTIRIIWI